MLTLMTQSIPIACTLSVADLRAQAQRWQRLMTRALTERSETADGLRLTFRPEAEDELRALVAVETGVLRLGRLDGRADRGWRSCSTSVRLMRASPPCTPCSADRRAGLRRSADGPASAWSARPPAAAVRPIWSTLRSKARPYPWLRVPKRTARQ